MDGMCRLMVLLGGEESLGLERERLWMLWNVFLVGVYPNPNRLSLNARHKLLSVR